MKTIKTVKFDVWENGTVDLYPIEIRSVEAWRESEGGWTYNNSFVICKEDVKNLLIPSGISNRKLLGLLRELDVLSAESKGRVRVVDQWPYVEIQLKDSQEPIIQILFDEDNRKELFV